MISLHAAGLTDVGQVRASNEDAMHVGDSVFAVADGMGGHQAGEVASALALEPLANLDGRVYADVDEARAALEEAVVAANAAVVRAAEHDVDLQGMGTTLTAALFEGRRLHLAHVGDSRAYLLRDGAVEQLTRDHTFVQQLVDAGSITEEEAARHPQRSVVTRAIGATAEVEIDLETLPLVSGDAVLLCSDGLSGVVPDERIAEVLRSERTPKEVVTTLVEDANDAGGPDNITAVLLTVVTGERAPATPASEPGEDVSDAVATQPSGPLVIRPDHDAGPARILPGPGPDESLVVDPVARRRKLLSIVLGVAVVLGLTLGGGRWLLSRSYFVGLDDDRVAIFQGIPVELGPLSPNWVFEETSLRAPDVSPIEREQLERGIAAANSSDARDIVENLRAASDAIGRDELDDTDGPIDDDASDPTSGRTTDTTGTTDSTDDPSPTQDQTP